MTGLERGDLLAQIKVPSPQDYLFLFTPSGNVQTNGLPRLEGSYRLIFTAGARYQPSILAPGLFDLTASSHATTVSLSALGKVWVEDGIPIANQVDKRLEPQPCPTASLPDLALVSNQAPEIRELTYSPDPSDFKLPPGVNSLVPQDGFLTVQVKAHSPGGAPLLMRLQEARGSNSLPGASSQRELSRMTWDAQDQLWVGRCQWTPPPSESAPKRHELQVEVKDVHGQSTQLGTVATTIKVEVREHSKKLVYSANSASQSPPTVNLSTVLNQSVGSPSDPSFTSAPEKPLSIFTVEQDSTRIRQVTHPLTGEADVLPDWSPDGSKILFLHQPKGPSNTWQLRVVGADGSGEKILVGNVMEGSCGWSPDGGKIVFQKLEGGKPALFVIRADGAEDPRRLTPVNDGWDYGENPTRLTRGELPKLQWTEPAFGQESIITTRYRPMKPEEANLMGKSALPLYGDPQCLIGEVVAVRLDQSGAISLDPCAATFYGTYRPTLYPEENWIAYTRVYRDGSAKLCRISLGTSAVAEELADAALGFSQREGGVSLTPQVPISLTPAPTGTQAPAWKPGEFREPSFCGITSDGKKVYFHGYGDNRGEAAIASLKLPVVETPLALIPLTTLVTRLGLISQTAGPSSIFSQQMVQKILSRLDLVDDERMSFSDGSITVVDLVNGEDAKKLVHGQVKQASGGWSP